MAPQSRLIVFRLLVAAIVGLCAVSGLRAQSAAVVVMSGLDNPRGLAVGPEGALYVAEAGRGGPGPCGVNSPGETRCYGPTGAITRLWRGQQERIATGLPSHAIPGGLAAAGPNDIALHGRGGAFITMGLGYDQRLRDAMGDAGPFFGTLIKMSASGEWRVIADLLAHETTVNPDGGVVDCNPYGVLAEDGSRLVTDAGGNSLLRVRANGAVTTVTTFPSRGQGRTTDAVPTAIVSGPDGAYYIAELSGVPFAAGTARIYRFVPGQVPEVFLTGFKMITDMAFDDAGNLFVVEHAGGAVFFGGPGRLLRVAPDGTRSVVLGDLDRPTSVAVGTEGELYVTNHGITAGIGEVLRINP